MAKKKSKKQGSPAIAVDARTVEVNMNRDLQFNMVVLSNGLSDAADMTVARFGANSARRFGATMAAVEFLVREDDGTVRSVNVDVDELRKWVIKKDTPR